MIVIVFFIEVQISVGTISFLAHRFETSEALIGTLKKIENIRSKNRYWITSCSQINYLNNNKEELWQLSISGESQSFQVTQNLKHMKYTTKNYYGVRGSSVPLPFLIFINFSFLVTGYYSKILVYLHKYISFLLF